MRYGDGVSDGAGLDNSTERRIESLALLEREEGGPGSCTGLFWEPRGHKAKERKPAEAG